jgi:peptidoglycan/LPS O-acetylase OafA/YrhL
VTTGAPRNAGIDVLRGLSIVLVIVHHVAIRIPLRKTLLARVFPTRVLDALGSNGYEAVFVFFVISGFLITTNSLNRWGRLEDIDVRGFYVRRAARIVPCLLVLVLVLSALHAADVNDFKIVNARQSLPRTVFSALGLHLNWYEGHTGWLPGSWDVLWSLSIEEAFYFCFPIVCVAFAGRRLFVPALVLLAASLPWTRAALAGNEIWQEKAYLPGMSAIAVGVLAALLVRHRRAPVARVVRLLAVAGAVGVGSMFIVEDLLWRVLGNGTILVLTVSAAAIVVACHWMAQQGQQQLSAGTAWLRSFGRLSYECYLTHMFVVFAVVGVFNATHASLAHGYLWYLAALVASWLLGKLVARFFSVPCEMSVRARWLAGAPTRPTFAPEP